MAWPWNHPTLAQYLCWAIQQGCKVQTGYATNKKGYTLPTTKITSPDGKRWVHIAGTKQSDYLVMTTVARYDRRLGLKSNFFEFPSATPAPIPDPPKKT